ncbi:hypothetical protein pipiens_020496, partial [Culex pipiens pipiens]
RRGGTVCVGRVRRQDARRSQRLPQTQLGQESHHGGGRPEVGRGQHPCGDCGRGPAGARLGRGNRQHQVRGVQDA